MKDKKFIIQLILFLLFALVAPIVYLSIRFDLFKHTTTISFWFLIVIAIFACVVVFLIKMYLDGTKTRFSYLKQVLQGIVKVVIPIALVILAMFFFKYNAEAIVKNIDVAMEALSVVLVCEIAAICVNPLPKWAFNNNVEGLAEICEKILNKGDTQ